MFNRLVDGLFFSCKEDRNYIYHKRFSFWGKEISISPGYNILEYPENLISIP